MSFKCNFCILLLIAVHGDVCLRAELGGKGLNESQGYVQIFRNGEWMNICDPKWGSTESLIVCRQLGLTGATNFLNMLSTENDIIKCNGTEDKLEQCIIKLDSHCKEGIHVTCTKPGFNPGNHLKISC